MPINVESAKASRRPASFVDALRLVVPASPSKFGTAFTFSPKMRLSLKLRPRAEGVDDHGRSGPSNEAASSIVSTGLMTRKTHTVGRVTLISPLPFLFPCASGSNVGNEARCGTVVLIQHNLAKLPLISHRCAESAHG